MTMQRDFRQIFGTVFTASGTRNFYGDGWSYHKIWRGTFGDAFSFEGSTHIAKTTTWDSREGNMPLNPITLQPLERRPKCIVIKPFKGVVLNSVGLSGPGAKHLFEQNVWQKFPESFVLSFMAVGANPEERLEEHRKFRDRLEKELLHFMSKIGLQINLSCPNTKHATKNLLTEAIPTLQIYQPLRTNNLLLDVKLNVLATPEAVIKIEQSGLCDCITASNTFPYGILPDRINWEKLFGKESPLVHLGGGGLSGKPCFPIICDWFKSVRDAGATGLMKLGNGILHPDDVNKAKDAGANGIEIGTVTIIRPWRVRSIIERANQIF